MERRMTLMKLIDHIGIVVKNVQDSIKIYQDGLGMNLLQIEDNEAFGVKIAFFLVGETLVELIEPTTPEGTMASQFLKEKGEGLHHIAFRVENLENTLNMLKEKAIPLIHETPQPGGLGALVAFMDPGSANNVYIEFIQRSLITES